MTAPIDFEAENEVLRTALVKIKKHIRRVITWEDREGWRYHPLPRRSVRSVDIITRSALGEVVDRTIGGWK